MLMLLVLTGMLYLGAAPLEASGALSGRRAPGFALPDENMKYHDLADHRGKVLLLEIMLTRCPNCQKLARTIEGLKETYGDRISVLAVVSPPDNRSTVLEFKKSHQITTPILFDCGQMVGSYLLPNPQHPRIHVPHLFLIDGDGMIRNDFGHTSESIFEGNGLAAEIDRLLQPRE
jgi:peroxiredoxin